MIDLDAVSRIIGAKVVDPDGSHLGTIVEVHLDDDTGRPEWAMVRSALSGAGTTCVPLSRAELMGDSLRVPFEKAVFASAPRIPAEQGRLAPGDESELRRHYGGSTARDATALRRPPPLAPPSPPPS